MLIAALEASVASIPFTMGRPWSRHQPAPPPDLTPTETGKKSHDHHSPWPDLEQRRPRRCNVGPCRPRCRPDRPDQDRLARALTGPSSAPAVGFNRGVAYAAEAINAAGGIKGRKVEIITRDTQGDPTKAVNATQEMISQLRVHAIWGPTNSGESLAVTAIMARGKMPNIHPCVVDSLIDPVRYPTPFASLRPTRSGTMRCAATP